jgi:hypothetical protein
MKNFVLVTTILLMSSSSSGCLGLEGDESPETTNQLQTELLLNHLQMKGTHNSYHIEPVFSPTREYMYTHEPLGIQASQQGVRQFEIDVWWDVREGLRVYHNQYDSGTTCPKFEDCLSDLLDWSQENSDHHTIFIWIEPKDWPEQATEITTTVELSNLLSLIEEEIDQFWPREKMVTPDDVRGQRGSLKEAVSNDGWPSVQSSRGKAIFILLATGQMRDLYVAQHPGLSGALMFTLSEESSEEAAIFSFADPVGDGEEISRLVNEGYIVRSRADSGGDEADNNDKTRLEAALSSGAHSISTDYPAQVEGFDYWVEIPNGTPSRCNPISSPAWCSSLELEDLQ